jgi:hypothetical protein
MASVNVNVESDDMQLAVVNVVNSGVGGGFVSATVVLESAAAVACRGVELTLTGVAHCEWQQGRGRAELFKHRVVLTGHAADDNDASAITVPAGRHEWPVVLALPDCIPPSLTAQFGAIEYLIKVVCHSHHAQLASAELALDVHGSRWPRVEAAFSAPRAAGAQKKFFMQSLDCRVLLQVDNPIGHVGSVLHGHVTVDNKSGKTIEAIGLEILQLVTWHANNRPNVSTVVTSSAPKQLVPDSNVPPADNRTVAFQLTIPDSELRPSVLTGTDCVVSVQHFVCATVQVKFAADFDVRVPFFFTPTPSQLAPSLAKPATTPIAPIAVNPNLVVALVDDGFAGTPAVTISAPAPVLVSRVGKRTDKPMMAKK